MKIGAGRVRSDVAHLYSLKDHGHGVLSEPKIMARRARTPENEACELGVALISWGTCWKFWGQSWVTAVCDPEEECAKIDPAQRQTKIVISLILPKVGQCQLYPISDFKCR